MRAKLRLIDKVVSGMLLYLPDNHEWDPSTYIASWEYHTYQTVINKIKTSQLRMVIF